MRAACHLHLHAPPCASIAPPLTAACARVHRHMAASNLNSGWWRPTQRIEFITLLLHVLRPHTVDGRNIQCAGFPTWPLSATLALYNDTVGPPQCQHERQPTPLWVLHQSSTPARRPSRSAVIATLHKLPAGTAYKWHSDDDICRFMTAQPLRFQALFNALPRTVHQVDLWRYLLLYQQGGIYLDDGAELLSIFNASFVNSVDSMYVTQGSSHRALYGSTSDEGGTLPLAAKEPFGKTIYNGFLVTKPCNHVLLSVAERMTQLGPPTWTIPHGRLSNWYNLKLLATAVAERAPQELHPNPHCRARLNTSGVTPQLLKCLLLSLSAAATATFEGQPLALYEDDRGWRTAVFDVPLSKTVVRQVGRESSKQGRILAELVTNRPAPVQRMIFTHVGKTGGSYIISLLGLLQKRNNFTLVSGALIHGFSPSLEDLTAQLVSMKSNSVYQNHASFVPGLTGPGWQWVSLLREPLDLWNSLFYYGVDMTLRKDKTMQALHRRDADPVCGCARLEFDACINTMYLNNCTMQVPSQYRYFCAPKENECTAELAFTRIRDYYVLVGLLEDMDLTLQALAKLVPWVFAGQEKVAHAVPHRSTSLFNPITQTTLNGALSTRSRKQIAERASNYEEEYRFYKQVRQLFYRRLCKSNVLRRR